MVVAFIDCGTNTIRLLVAELGVGGDLVTLHRELRYVRLGQGVDATGRFHPDALERVFAATDDYARTIAEYPVSRTRFIATSACRDVSNREEFFAGIKARLGVVPDVISGEEEARLSFLGALAGGPILDSATTDLICDNAATVPGRAATVPGRRSGAASDSIPDDRPGSSAGDGNHLLDCRILVVDIGGGSTELILGRQSGVIEQAVSLQMGSVRLRERFLHDDPPTAEQIEAARAFVNQLLDQSGVPLAEAAGWLVDGPQLDELKPASLACWIGVAGTNTSLSALHQRLVEYDPTKVHNSTVTVNEILTLSDQLFRWSVADTMTQFPILAPLRAEVICAGVMIAAEIARRVGLPMLVRETDILDGGALDLLQ